LTVNRSQTRRYPIEVAEGVPVEELAHPGPDILPRFLAAWHGPRQSGYGIPPAELAGRPLPKPLRAFYELAGRWPGLVAQNHLLEPAQLSVVDGWFIFYVENQGVREWATTAHGDDPPVWSRSCDPGASWEPEGELLSRFLVQLVLFETIWLAPEGASAPCLNEEQLRNALDPLRLLPLAPWRWPAYPAYFYAGRGVLATACPNATCGGATGAEYHDFSVGARRPDAIAYLASLVDETWAHYSPQDSNSR